MSELLIMTTTAQVTAGFHSILNSLTEKEKSVIMRRIGFNGNKETLQEIGARSTNRRCRNPKNRAHHANQRPGGDSEFWRKNS